MKTASADTHRVDGRQNEPVGPAVASRSHGRSGARAPEPAAAGQLRLALKQAVHLFARDPCETNANRVELAIAALRRRGVRPAG